MRLIVAAEAQAAVTETSRGLGASRYWALFHFRGAGASATRSPYRALLHREKPCDRANQPLAPEGKHLEVARELARSSPEPPLSVRSTVRTRAGTWSARPASPVHRRPFQLSDEDFQEAARPLPKTAARPFKGGSPLMCILLWSFRGDAERRTGTIFQRSCLWVPGCSLRSAPNDNGGERAQPAACRDHRARFGQSIRAYATLLMAKAGPM